MTDAAISHPTNALVTQDRIKAYIAAGWTCVNSNVPTGYEDDARALMRWERDDEPVIPAGLSFDPSSLAASSVP